MTRLPSHAGLFCFARAVSGFRRCGGGAAVVVFVRARVRFPALLQVGSQCIGVGNGALGQAIYLPQCGLTCPIVWFRAPVRLAGVRFRSDTSAFTVIPRSASVIPPAK